jgi:hypothetical protein
MEVEGRKLNLAYYGASDGPRIMLFGSLDSDFQTLQQLFRDVGQCKVPVELHLLPSIQAFGGIRLVLSCSRPAGQLAHGKPEGVRRIASASGKEFHWRRTAEGWNDLADLIDGVVKSPVPGHQYLSSYPSEDAIVVLSKGEYGDDVLERLTET